MTTTTNAPSVAVAALGGIFTIVARLWPRVVSRWDADGGASYEEDWIQDQTGNVITTNSTELREIGANFGNARSPSVRANASEERNALPHTFVIEDLVFRIGLRRCRGEMACYRQSATDAAAPAPWLYGARIFWIDTPDNPVGTARSLRSYAETLIELRSDGQFTVRCFSTVPITTTNSIDLLPVFATVPFVVRSSSRGRGGNDDLLTKVQLIDRDGGGQMLAIDAVKIRSAVLRSGAHRTANLRLEDKSATLKFTATKAEHGEDLIIRLPGDDEEYALPSNAALLWLPATALSVAADTQFVVSTLDNTLSGVVGVRLEHIGMILSALGVQTELLPLSGDGVHWAVRVGFQRRIRTMGTPVAYELRAGQSGFAGNWKLPEAERQLRADSASLMDAATRRVLETTLPQKLASGRAQYQALTTLGGFDAHGMPALPQELNERLIRVGGITKPFHDGDYQPVACPVCAVDEPAQRCSGCRRAVYCSEACQRLDWHNGHQDTCDE